MAATKQLFADEFKESVVQCHLEHPDKSIAEVAKQFGISDSVVHSWKKKYTQNNGSISSRGSGNHSSDKAKEIARLKKELKGTQDALDVLKRLSGYWANNRYPALQFFEIKG